MTLGELRESLGDLQKQLLQRITDFYLANGKGVLSRELYKEFGKPQVIEALRALGGIVYEAEDSQAVSSRYEPTFVGLLLPVKGEHHEHLLVGFLEYLEMLYRTQPPDRNSVSSGEIEEVLKLTKEEAFQFYFLAQKAHLSSSSSYSIAEHTWNMQIFREIDDLPSWPSKQDFIRFRAMESYDPAAPVLLSERQGCSALPGTDKASNKCKILFLTANPKKTGRLALDEESREIDQKIRAADYRDALELITKWATRPDDLLQYLNEHRPHVVHFSGHGSSTEGIILQDVQRRSKPVSKAALKQLFTTLKDNIRVVVLSACYSRPQAEAIVEVIDCAIGMRKAIGDKAAMTFAASFYRAIGFGRSVQEAFDQGKTALMLEAIPEEDTPELLVRKGVNPKTVFLIRPSGVVPKSLVDSSVSSAADATGQLKRTPSRPNITTPTSEDGLGELLRITEKANQKQKAYMVTYVRAERVMQDPKSSDEDKRRANRELGDAVADFLDAACSYSELYADPALIYQTLASSSTKAELEEVQQEANEPLKSQGEWSRAMTKKAMMWALGIASYRNFNAFARRHGIEQAGNRQLYRIRMGEMDVKTRQKLR
jgi:hypothetical protein